MIEQDCSAVLAMVRISMAFVLFTTGATTAMAQCDNQTPSEVVAKYYVSKAVMDSEKADVTHVELPAPGMALVTYRVAAKAHIARVTYTFDCLSGAALMANPFGFRVVSYAPNVK
jgi:hypothetical protein